MDIQVAITPNPLVKKFTVAGTTGKPLGPYDDLHVSYNNNPIPYAQNRSLKDAEKECPLAAQLMQAGVYAITLDQGSAGAFVTIGIQEKNKALWPAFEEATVAVLNAYLGDGKSAFTQDFKPAESQEAYHKRVLGFIDEKYGEQGTKIVKPILVAIEAMSPAIKGDGGNLKFQSIDFETNKVFVEMTGACSGCSKTGDTLGNIEAALKEYFNLDVKMINTTKVPNQALQHDTFAIG